MEQNNENQKIEELTDEQLKEVAGGNELEVCKQKCKMRGYALGVAYVGGVSVGLNGEVNQCNSNQNTYNQCIVDCESRYSGQ